VTLFFPRFPRFPWLKNQNELFLASVLKETGSGKLKCLSNNFTISLMFSSVPVLFSNGPFYLPVTCWLPGESVDSDAFLDWYAAEWGLNFENRRLVH
jgi:hypothetical protein